VQECLIYKALFLKELMFDVPSCNVIVVVVVLVLVDFLFSLAFLVVLGRVFNSFILRKVHREVCEQLYIRRVTSRKELRAGSLTLFVCIVS
jgi:hypothetical protein